MSLIENVFVRRVMIFVAIHLVTAEADAAWTCGVKLIWQQNDGVVLQTPAGVVLLDRGATSGLVLRFQGTGIEQRLYSPEIERCSEKEMLLRYKATGPMKNPIQVIRHIEIASREGEAELVEEFILTPSKTIGSDLEIERPFTLRAVADKPEAILPRYDGWARTFALGSDPLRGEWQLGNVMCDVPSQHLALPVVQVGQKGKWIGAICADPFFGSLYELSVRDGEISGTVRYRYACSKVPLVAGEKEVRRFGVWLADAKQEEPFGRSIDAFFRLMLPDVPPGATWLHEIAMVDFDFLSDNGQGWEKDVKELGRLLSPEERPRVALCLHGWYETIGGYSYDDATKAMKPEWVAMGRTRKVHLTQDEIRRRLKLARDLGFRVLLYFADGLLQDSGVPCYRPDWDFVDEKGAKISGWTGPDTWGQTFARNPANPQVSQWHRDYLAALLKAFGTDLDGFVWDESYYIGVGAIVKSPQPAYCDRATMELMKTLTQMVHTADAEKVFLSSDCLGFGPWATSVPAYGIVTNGTYADAACGPTAWSYGLFPNWRNTFWSWQLVADFSIPANPLGRGKLRRTGGDLQRLGGRSRAMGMDVTTAG